MGGLGGSYPELSVVEETMAAHGLGPLAVEISGELTIGNYPATFTVVGLAIESGGDWPAGGYMDFTNEGIVATVTFDGDNTAIRCDASGQLTREVPGPGADVGHHHAGCQLQPVGHVDLVAQAGHQQFLVAGGQRRQQPDHSHSG